MRIVYPFKAEVKTFEQAQEVILHMCDYCENIFFCSGAKADICNRMKKQISEIFSGLADTAGKTKVYFGVDTDDFLSNSYLAKISHMGFTFTSVEAAYQASKCLSAEETGEFANIDPQEARCMGECVSLREDWESVKEDIMRELLTVKFADSGLRKQLLETGDKELVFETTKASRFWGVRNGKGMNVLGKLLMEIRDQAREAAGISAKNNKELMTKEFLLVEIVVPAPPFYKYILTDASYDSIKDVNELDLYFWLIRNGYVAKEVKIDQELRKYILVDVSKKEK